MERQKLITIATPPTSRREFLATGAAVAAGACLGPSFTQARPTVLGVKAERCILLFLTGGPSQLDTFDPKPHARSDVRGPFGIIPSRVPGITLSELLPKTADRANDLVVVRSVNHVAAPIHETGQQLVQTGRLSSDDHDFPHFGAVLASRLGAARSEIPPFVLLPGPIGNTGVGLSHGQSAGSLSPRCRPCTEADLSASVRDAVSGRFESPGVAASYGATRFGQRCLLARRLVEAGSRCVVVNMFDTVYGQRTWDCHADRGHLFSTLNDYRDVVVPTFDGAFSALIDDLRSRGMLESTLVLAVGEFGRTPIINSAGGRDHWPGVWSMVVAGGGVRGGQVVGASDSLGGEVRDRPVSGADIVATVYHAFGLRAEAYSQDRADEGVAGAPITEIF